MDTHTDLLVWHFPVLYGPAVLARQIFQVYFSCHLTQCCLRHNILCFHPYALCRSSCVLSCSRHAPCTLLPWFRPYTRHSPRTILSCMRYHYSHLLRRPRSALLGLILHDLSAGRLPVYYPRRSSFFLHPSENNAGKKTAESVCPGAFLSAAL